jgi:hypothetical protein
MGEIDISCAGSDLRRRRGVSNWPYGRCRRKKEAACRPARSARTRRNSSNFDDGVRVFAETASRKPRLCREGMKKAG